MKFLITERQYRRLLSEGDVYSNKADYEEALLRYEDAMKFKEGRDIFDNVLDQLYSGKITYTQSESEYIKWQNTLKEIEKKYPKYLDGNRYISHIGISLQTTPWYIREGCLDKNTDKIYYELEPIKLNYGDMGENYKPRGCNGVDSVMYRTGVKYIYPEKPIYSPIEPTVNQPEDKNTKRSPSRGDKISNKYSSNKMLDSGLSTDILLNKMDSGVAPFAGKIIDALNRKKNPVLTNFVIEFMWGGNRKLVYFKTYEDYSKIVGSVDRRLGGNSNENASRTSAESEIYKDPSELGLGVKGKSDASLSIVFIWSGYKKVVWFKTYEEFNKICNSVDKSRKGNFTEDASGTWARCEIYASPSEFGL